MLRAAISSLPSLLTTTTALASLPQSKEDLLLALTFITNSFVLRLITCHPKLTYTPTFLYLLVLVYIPQFQISFIINASIVILPTLLIIKY